MKKLKSEKAKEENKEEKSKKLPPLPLEKNKEIIPDPTRYGDWEKGGNVLIFENSLEVSALGYRRGKRWIINNISLTLLKGKILWIKGRNGIGKSTLLKLLTGIIPIEQGFLTLKEPICYLGHQLALPYFFSTMEIFQYYEKMYGPCLQLQDSLLKKWGLEECADKPFFHLSAGQKKRVALARIDFCSQRCWLFDEPCTHLDTQAQEIFFTCLAYHCQQRGSACIVHHGQIPSFLDSFSSTFTFPEE